MPVSGYCESQARVAVACGSGRVQYSSTYCEACELRYRFDYAIYLSSNYSVLQCKACPFDCRTCYPDDRCSSCAPQDFREIDYGSMRCLPMSGYYESNTTVASWCDPSSALAVAICNITNNSSSNSSDSNSTNSTDHTNTTNSTNSIMDEAPGLYLGTFCTS